MKRIVKSIGVNVPVHAAYEQWMHLEDLPKFMDSVEEVRRIDDRVSCWVINMDGDRQEFLVTLTGQVPDREIAWTSATPLYSTGRITLESIGANETRVTFALEFDPRRPMEKLASLFGMTERQVRGDLVNFKNYIEAPAAKKREWGSIDNAT